MEWYRKAAEQGVPDAQTNLGELCANGHGIPKDDVEAVKRFRKAAEQGDARAQFDLDRLCEAG
jgi:TPR repeat protein